MKYIDADLLRKEIEFAWSVYNNPHRVVHGIADAFRQDGRAAMCEDILKKMDSLQQEQQEDLASLINEATNVAKRIVDRDSFYNTLPQNLRNKYTSKAWREILEAITTMKEQEQPDVDFEKELKNERTKLLDTFGPMNGEQSLAIKNFARHFYELGLNARKEE